MIVGPLLLLIVTMVKVPSHLRHLSPSSSLRWASVLPFQFLALFQSVGSMKTIIIRWNAPVVLNNWLQRLPTLFGKLFLVFFYFVLSSFFNFAHRKMLRSESIHPFNTFYNWINSSLLKWNFISSFRLTIYLFFCLGKNIEISTKIQIR